MLYATCYDILYTIYIWKETYCICLLPTYLATSAVCCPCSTKLGGRFVSQLAAFSLVFQPAPCCLMHPRGYRCSCSAGHG